MANLDFISHQTICDVNGTPLPGAKVFYYLTGTTTLQNTYSDAGLTAANTNPVICDANGVVPEVYLAATRYKRTVKTSADVSLPQYDCDPLDASQEYITLAALPSPAYPLLRVALTADGHTYRRNLANSAWIDEGLTDSLINSATVTDQLTGTSSSLSSTPDSVAGLWQRGTDIASAATLSLPATGGGVFNITGTTNISAISSAQGGRTIKVRFAGALTITHNATSMILPGAANITTVAGDTAEFVNEGAADAASSNWRCFNYQRNSGSSINITDQLGTQSEAETGTSTTKTLSIANHVFHDSSMKGWMAWDGTGTPTATDVFNFAAGAGGITDNGAGDYTLTYTTAFSTAEGYAIAGMCNQIVAANMSGNFLMVRGTAASAVATTNVRVNAGNVATGAVGDKDYNGIIFAGDR